MLLILIAGMAAIYFSITCKAGGSSSTARQIIFLSARHSLEYINVKLQFYLEVLYNGICMFTVKVCVQLILLTINDFADIKALTFFLH